MGEPKIQTNPNSKDGKNVDVKVNENMAKQIDLQIQNQCSHNGDQENFGDGLKGQFYVYDPQNEEYEGQNTPILNNDSIDKILTLVFCKNPPRTDLYHSQQSQDGLSTQDEELSIQKDENGNLVDEKNVLVNENSTRFQDSVIELHITPEPGKLDNVTVTTGHGHLQTETKSSSYILQIPDGNTTSAIEKNNENIFKTQNELLWNKSIGSGIICNKPIIIPTSSKVDVSNNITGTPSNTKSLNTNTNIPDTDKRPQYGAVHCYDRMKKKPRSRNFKRFPKSRRQLQMELAAEFANIDENGSSSVDRAIEERASVNRGKSMNPKTLGKPHNKTMPHVEINNKHHDPIKEGSLPAETSSKKKNYYQANRSVQSLFRPASAPRRLGEVSRLSAENPPNEPIHKVNRSITVLNLHSDPSQLSQFGQVGNEGQIRSSLDSSTTASSWGSRPNLRSFASHGKFTKFELSKALPRKSFFNCHDKVLKEAGLEVEDAATKRRAERLKARLELIAKEFEPRPTKPLIENNNNKSDMDPITEVSLLETDDKEPITNHDDNEEADSLNHGNNEANLDDMIDGKLRPLDSLHVHQSHGKKKRLHPEKSDHVDCKPLAHYLEYVKENQTEYENFCHSSLNSSVNKNKPIRRLINMGRAFELRHLGGSPKTKTDDVIVMAAKAVRPRTSDASKYHKSNEHDRALKVSGHDNSHLRQTRPPSEDKRRQEKNSSNTNTTKEEEHAKTELEKKKLKAEEWAMSVSTNTLTKAKLQSLRELGTDDEELSKWWVAFKKCHYLRIKGVEE